MVLPDVVDTPDETGQYCRRSISLYQRRRSVPRPTLRPSSRRPASPPPRGTTRYGGRPATGGPAGVKPSSRVARQSLEEEAPHERRSNPFEGPPAPSHRPVGR